VGGLHHPLGCFTRVILQKVALSLIADTELQEPDFNGPCPSLYVLSPWTETIDTKRARSFRSPAVCY
jgi:hypothetical protein